MQLSASKLDSPNHSTRDDVPLFLGSQYNSLYINEGYDVYQFKYDSPIRDSLIAFFGIKDTVMSSPFSAPYGGFWPSNEPVESSTYTEMAVALVNHARKAHLSRIQITLPPECYTGANTSTQAAALVGAGFTVEFIDTNHSLRLNDIGFEKGLHRGARRSLRQATSAGLTFMHAQTDGEQGRAYDVIRKNRQQKGRPLKLSREGLKKVAKITNVDYFLVTQSSVDVAGAIVYKISSSVVQVIYWGNDVSYNSLNSIHFLAMHLFGFYQENYALLDIGPSSSLGVIDEGLAKFKESIGCQATEKPAFTIDIESAAS